MLLSFGWGTLWGIALGLWILAPAVTNAHHLRPEVPSQWLVLLGALIVIFAVLGAVLGFIGGFALSVIERLIVGAFLERTWAYALFSGITVAILYAVQSFAIHWITYEAFDFPPRIYWSVIVFSISCVIASGVA